ncbi:MAG: hypothetical protein HFI38_08850 [Lachnospiraceae bacterium]|jgi:mannose/fructose/sorbose-specific phosphotransferase system IIA component|nr:hypothetical protein [Lachnospiraceae bacterium]
MIGVIICTHSDFAKGLKNACEMIAGPQEALKAVCFMGDEQITELGERLAEESKEFEDGCVFVVDLENATPFNASLMAIAYTESVVLSGASMPMLLELLSARTGFAGTPEELVTGVLALQSCFVSMKRSRDVFTD